jgi:hypothetical protein
MHWSSYDPEKYNEIRSLHESNQLLQTHDRQELIETKLKPLFFKYGVADRFGVGLVHRHFPLPKDTILVEKDNTSSPWKCKSYSKYGGQIVPTSWLYQDGKIYPYEFAFVHHQQAKSPLLDNHALFAEDFFRSVTKLGLNDCIGLRSLPRHDFRGVLECTEGNVNINFDYGQVTLNSI